MWCFKPGYLCLYAVATLQLHLQGWLAACDKRNVLAVPAFASLHCCEPMMVMLQYKHGAHCTQSCQPYSMDIYKKAETFTLAW
jgi:hypothetical protein